MWLALLFLVMPFVELAVIVGAASSFGLGWTMLALVVVSLAGAWLVRREGWSAYRRVRQQIERGEVPTTTLVDGLLILFAGALLLTPGFVSDVVGLLLLLPPTRAVFRAQLRRGLHRRAHAVVVGVGPSMSGAGGFGATVVDVDEVSPRRGRPLGRAELEGS